jgi:catechol 2,3-dioxygenase-like lactoylglutathione lyase family enzyme
LVSPAPAARVASDIPRDSRAARNRGPMPADRPPAPSTASTLLRLASCAVIEINGVAHVVLRVNRFRECVAFYDRLMPFLGLEVVHRSDELVYYVGGRTALGVRPAEHAEPAHVETAPGLDHICWRARSREDVDAVHALLLELGADLVRAPEAGPWAPGYYSLSFRDPEGVRLEINHVPGRGVLADGAAFDPAPGYPLEGGG